MKQEVGTASILKDGRAVFNVAGNKYHRQPNRVYEVPNRKRPLTLRMVWRLHKGLGIPTESLIKVPGNRAA
jgi:hypothetical protein